MLTGGLVVCAAATLAAATLGWAGVTILLGFLAGGCTLLIRWSPGGPVTGAVLAYLPSPSRSVLHLGPLPICAYALCIVAGILLALTVASTAANARGVWRTTNIATLTTTHNGPSSEASLSFAISSSTPTSGPRSWIDQRQAVSSLNRTRTVTTDQHEPEHQTDDEQGHTRSGERRHSPGQRIGGKQARRSTSIPGC